MQTTLRIDKQIYRETKAQAAQLGETVTRFIEVALRQRLERTRAGGPERDLEIAERDRLMEQLLQRTAHFRIGPKPTRDELHER